MEYVADKGEYESEYMVFILQQAPRPAKMGLNARVWVRVVVPEARLLVGPVSYTHLKDELDRLAKSL